MLDNYLAGMTIQSDELYQINLAKFTKKSSQLAADSIMV